MNIANTSNASLMCYLHTYLIAIAIIHVTYHTYLTNLIDITRISLNMLKICNEFGERYSVIFNAIKSKCLLCFFLIEHAACLMPQLLSSILGQCL